VFCVGSPARRIGTQVLLDGGQGVATAVKRPRRVSRHHGVWFGDRARASRQRVLDLAVDAASWPW